MDQDLDPPASPWSAFPWSTNVDYARSSLLAELEDGQCPGDIRSHDDGVMTDDHARL
jgi:hypothetical protein